MEMVRGEDKHAKAMSGTFETHGEWLFLKNSVMLSAIKEDVASS